MSLETALLWLALLVVGNTIIGNILDHERLAQHRASLAKLDVERARADHEFWALQIDYHSERLLNGLRDLGNQLYRGP